MSIISVAYKFELNLLTQMHIINLEDRIASASLEHFNEEIAFHWLGYFCHFLLADFLLGAMYELITKSVQIWRFHNN